MAGIITDVQAREKAREGAFAQALREGSIALVQQVFVQLVEESYESHSMRHRTHNEDRRRAVVLLKWFRTLREEHRYPVDRALHTLRAALAAELDGKKFDPPRIHVARQMYAVDERIDHLATALKQQIKTGLVH